MEDKVRLCRRPCLQQTRDVWRPNSISAILVMSMCILADETTPLIINPVTVTKSSNDQNLVQELLSVSSSDFVDSGILRKIYTVIKVSY